MTDRFAPASQQPGDQENAGHLPHDHGKCASDVGLDVGVAAGVSADEGKGMVDVKEVRSRGSLLMEGGKIACPVGGCRNNAGKGYISTGIATHISRCHGELLSLADGRAVVKPVLDLMSKTVCCVCCTVVSVTDVQCLDQRKYRKSDYYLNGDTDRYISVIWLYIPKMENTLI